MPPCRPVRPRILESRSHNRRVARDQRPVEHAHTHVHIRVRASFHSVQAVQLPGSAPSSVDAS